MLISVSDDDDFVMVRIIK